MKKLTIDHLNDLVIGAAILGSGGGGEPTHDYRMARFAMEKSKKPVSLISFSDLKKEDLVVPIGYMGAPTVEREKFLSGREYTAMFSVLEKILRKKVTVVMPFEIGGGSAFLPLMVASQLGIPVLDADMMGRAFPEGQMTACNLLNADPILGLITDCLDNTVALYPKDGVTLEKIGRQIAIGMGSSCNIGYYPMGGLEIPKYCIPKSITRALTIGEAHRKAKESGADPLNAILKICKGNCIGSGKIIDIDQVISAGFLNGTVIIQDKKDKLEIAMQNEYLVAKRNDEIVATTPDIIMLLEQETGTPITSESLQFGLKVNLIVLPAPDLWTTPEGLALTGPRYFGYDIDYKPIIKPKKK